LFTFQAPIQAPPIQRYQKLSTLLKYQRHWSGPENKPQEQAQDVVVFSTVPLLTFFLSL